MDILRSPTLPCEVPPRTRLSRHSFIRKCVQWHPSDGCNSPRWVRSPTSAIRSARQTVRKQGCGAASAGVRTATPRSLAQTVVHFDRRTSRWCPQGRGWVAAGRACEAARSAGLGARARSALRHLTRCRCLTTASAASGGSSATGPRVRAPQCSRCTHRPPHRSARRLPSLGLACADRRGLDCRP